MVRILLGKKERVITYLGSLGLVSVFDDGLEVAQYFAFCEDRPVIVINNVEPICNAVVKWVMGMEKGIGTHRIDLGGGRRYVSSRN